MLALRDHLKLHAVVLAWGLTAIIGRLIALPAFEVVVLRTALSMVGLYVLARTLNVSLRLHSRTTLGLLATGVLIGLHWILFFAAGKVANATIAVAGLPTTMVWTSLFQWALYKKRPRWYEVLLGAAMAPALWLILRFEVRYSEGFLLSIAAAVVGSLFAALNGQLAQRHHFAAIAFYQMAGGFGVSALLLPLFETPIFPTLPDFCWLLVLSLVCTVYAYTAYVELLRRLSVFTINLVYNLEPVYSIALAALFLQEHRDLSPQFYLGTALIVASVLAYPFIQRREKPPDTAALASRDPLGF